VSGPFSEENRLRDALADAREHIKALELQLSCARNQNVALQRELTQLKGYIKRHHPNEELRLQ
jgi:hypothetical protein